MKKQTSSEDLGDKIVAKLQELDCLFQKLLDETAKEIENEEKP